MMLERSEVFALLPTQVFLFSFTRVFFNFVSANRLHYKGLSD